MIAMTTWASIAETRPATSIPAEPSQARLALGNSYAVLDASAVIGTSAVHSFADDLVTTSEVYNEIQDKQSKQTLATLPFGINVQEPTDESRTAVTKFARATGDIHSLSTADLRLIALAHTLHTARHGKDSLRAEPVPPRVSRKSNKGTSQLPGWGVSGGAWEELDNLNEAEIAAYEEAYGTAAVSQIADNIHNLGLESEPTTSGSLQQLEQLPADSASTDETGAPSVSGQQVLPENEDSGSEWEVACVSHNAAHRRRRKAARKAARQVASQHAGSYSRVVQPAGQLSEQKAVSSEQDSVKQRQAAQRHQTDDSAPSELDTQLEPGQDSSAEGSEVDAADDSELRTAASQEPEQASVSIVTADFAMQNVILQMGLRLVAPDGRRVCHICRWVLRCSACFKVTKEMERLFCPTCGNAALQKVEMVIGENGAEQYGVRKKHIIRGTRYSLPKPKGGKDGKNLILREDVLMQRMPRRKPKEVSVDAFAPEFNSTSWHEAKGAAPSSYHKGVAAALASWKHNPNERRHARTNRRK